MFAPLKDKLRDEVEREVERVREMVDDLDYNEDDENHPARVTDVRNAAVSLADWIEDYLAILDREE